MLSLSMNAIYGGLSITSSPAPRAHPNITRADCFLARRCLRSFMGVSEFGVLMTADPESFRFHMDRTKNVSDKRNS